MDVTIACSLLENLAFRWESMETEVLLEWTDYKETSFVDLVMFCHSVWLTWVTVGDLVAVPSGVQLQLVSVWRRQCLNFVSQRPTSQIASSQLCELFFLFFSTWTCINSIPFLRKDKAKVWRFPCLFPFSHCLYRVNGKWTWNSRQHSGYPYHSDSSRVFAW